MKGLKGLASFLLMLVAVQVMAKDKHVVQVQVLSAKTRHWTTVEHDDGSPGTQKTDCSSYGDNDATCTTKTEGYRAPSDTTVHHTEVDVVIQMPDGTSVTAQCTTPDIRFRFLVVSTTCIEPQPGKYEAKVDKHGVRLLIPIQGRPEYKEDGMLKKAGKISVTEIKFSFE